MRPFTFALLAHQGGWDEILLVVGPIAVIVGLLAVVRRRLSRVGQATGGPSDVVQGDPLDRGPQ